METIHFEVGAKAARLIGREIQDSRASLERKENRLLKEKLAEAGIF